MSSHSVKRIAVGALVFLHALAHASIGVWAIADHNPWVVEPLWGIAMIGYFAAVDGEMPRSYGEIVVGTPGVRNRSRSLSAALSNARSRSARDSVKCSHPS